MERREHYEEGGGDRANVDLTGDGYILEVDPATILKGIFGCASAEEVESTAGFARYMSHVGCTLANYPIFLRLLQTNNRWVIDSLLGEREARLLFTNIRPNGFLVSKGFQLLSLWHPGEIYPKVLRAVMGIIENAFYDPDDGYRIYRLKLSDVNSIGKFLDEEKDQFEETNAVALDVLDRISQLGTYDSNPRKKALSKHAFSIRMAYFDNSKHCFDVIPQVLLTRLDSTATEVRPRKEYEAYLSGSRTPDEPQQATVRSRTRRR